MIDLIGIEDGDLVFADSQIPKAKNILSIQAGSLTYNPTFGSDFNYFLSEQFQFQTESFKAYLLNRLTAYSIDVASVVDVFNSFAQQYGIVLRNRPANQGFIK